jgi:uncharacterized protein (DUF1697 family)
MGTVMQTWVALLRGINVGGNNLVPMADLRKLCAGLGWTEVQSYIASGNLVFWAEGQADGLALVLRQAIAAQMGCDVPIIVLGAAAVRAALAGCPFDPVAGKQVHGFALWSDPVVDTVALERFRAPTEQLVVRGRVAWLYAPDGVGHSKLAEKFEQVVTGTQMTGRNLNTWRKLAEMLDGSAVA